jgi:RHS repeat-associated protein
VTTYDREGPNSLSNSGTSLVNNIRYNGKMQLTNLTRATGGLDTTYLYHPQNDVAGGGLGDSNYRLKTIQHGAAGTGIACPDFTYEYDKVGNISKMSTVSTAGTDSQNFGYDHLNRLLTAVGTGGVANYTHNSPSTDFEYNQLGNITYFGNATAYNYTTRHANCGAQPAHAQPHAVKQIGANYYCYDANGNMTKRVEAGVTYAQNFDVENRLTSVVSNGQTTTFAYDAAGMRVKTVKPNGTVIDHPFPNYEVENPAATPLIRATFGIAGQAIAMRISGDPVSTNNGLFYIHSDHLGSTTRYLPFGGYRGTAPTQTITDRDFTGQKENRELGLLYYGARFYVPGIGRFASADTIVPNPANPQSFNRYSYVRNSPLNMTDPTGHKECDLETGNCDGGSGTYRPPSSPTSIPNQVTQGNNNI